MSGDESFVGRLERVRERIAAAAERSGRCADDITVIAVSKRQPLDSILEARAIGIVDFGENYVQEALVKSSSPALSDCRWHMLGHLQSNKAKIAVETFELIQSVDSIRLASILGRASLEAGKVQKILLQVHLGDEETKFGFKPETVADAAAKVVGLPGVELLGLMSIASQMEDARVQFRLLRSVFDALPNSSRTVLSMGMTGDFEAGIEEGATMVRIGTALFGARR
jgi:pyridoxal phosphate enzyme (YggS family)